MPSWESPKRGRNQKWLHNRFHLEGPNVGQMTTEPLPARGPVKQGHTAKLQQTLRDVVTPMCGKIGCIVLSALRHQIKDGIKRCVHNPYRVGRQHAGTKGSEPMPCSGSQKQTRNPNGPHSTCLLRCPKKRTERKVAAKHMQSWAPLGSEGFQSVFTTLAVLGPS